MSKFFAIVAFAVALPMSNPAHAYIKCDKKEDAKAKKKCEKNMDKSLAKQRANTTPYTPSTLGKAFSDLDGDNNPFNSDDFYFGEKNTGIKQVDAFTAKVNKVAATVKMAKYIGHLNKSDAAAATKLGGAILPELIKLKDEAPALVEEAQKLVGEAATLVENPMDAPKALKALTGAGATIGKAVGDIPGAIAAVKPIAGGAAAGAISNVAGQVGDAVNQATDAVNQATDAAKQATDAVDSVKDAAGN